MIIALEYRAIRLDPTLDHQFRDEVAYLPGTDPIQKYVLLCMQHDPNLFWLDDDLDLYTGIVGAIHMLSRQALWLPEPTYDALLAMIQGLWMGCNVKGLDACRVVYEARRAA